MSAGHVEPPTAQEMKAFVEALREMRLHAEFEKLCRARGTSLQEVRGPSIARPALRARHEMMLRVALAFPDYSYPTIGRLFGRAHTTVINALRGTKAEETRRRRVRVEAGTRYRVG
jgi:chromosomal replication initiation ATPase DnaA